MSQMCSDGGIEPVGMVMKKWCTIDMEPFESVLAAHEFIERVEQLVDRGYLKEPLWKETTVVSEQSSGDTYIMYIPIISRDF